MGQLRRGVGVVAGGDEWLSGGVNSDAGQCDEVGRGGGDQSRQFGV